MTDNEELIKEAAKAIREVHDSQPPFGGYDEEGSARAALAVFEKAHARELQTLRNVVKDYETNFPCDGGCNTNDGPEETCSRHGRSPRDLWDRLEATEKALTPTNDEREALLEAAAENYRPGHRDSVHDRDYWEAMAYKDGYHDGFRRTEAQSEPKNDESCAEWCNHCQVCGEGILYGSRCREHYQNSREPQAEPSEVWLNNLSYAATVLEASDDNGDRYCARLIREHLAALRAAAKTGGGR